jgi:Spy/CpxP family protein refolding chaperone
MKTTTRLGWAAALLVCAAATAWTQQPPAAPRGAQPMPADTPPPFAPGMGPGRMGNPERMQQLRMQVEERWGRMVQTELQLNDEQMGRLRQAMRANQDRRRDLARRQADIRLAIGGQLQPGVAANQDSLNRLMDAMGRLGVERAQSDQQFMRDVQFLTPVQRARLFVMQRAFEQRVQGIIRQRGMAPGLRGRMGMPPRDRGMPPED